MLLQGSNRLFLRINYPRIKHASLKKCFLPNSIPANHKGAGTTFKQWWVYCKDSIRMLNIRIAGEPPDLSPALQWMLRRITHWLSSEYLSSTHPPMCRYQSSRITEETKKYLCTTSVVHKSMGHLCLLDHFISTSKSVMNMRKSVSLLVSSQCYNWATSSFFTYLSWQQPCENSRLVLQRKVRHSCAFVHVTGKVKGRDLNLHFTIPRLRNWFHCDLFSPVSIISYYSFSSGT